MTDAVIDHARETQIGLWPAQLDHLTRESNQPETLVAFYRDALGMEPKQLSRDLWLLQGPQRRVLIQQGTRGAQPMNAFRLDTAARVTRLRDDLAARGVEILDCPTPLFAAGFGVRDPDGRLVAFGVPDDSIAAQRASTLPAARLPGRLQHVVVATDNLERLIAFYRRGLGFVASDNVFDGPPESGPVTATFLRSDPEHHSFAAFRAPKVRPDHHCYETNCWNDIRDWADHMATLHIKLWWGPGRHGPGNNLFFMIEDPEGHKVELSAELEIMPQEMPPRAWKHEERTLNYWGQAWMRS
jgi:catechol 2,3-dioxygenase